jgi:hypothetical protein
VNGLEGSLSYSVGSTIAQAVSRQLPTAAARVPDQVSSCGICDGRNGTGAGFPCQLSFHHTFHTHLFSGAGTIGQIVADVQNGLSLTPPQET